MFRLMARASWLASIIGILVTLIGWVITMLRGVVPISTSLVALLAFGCGLVVGLVALCGVFSYGRKKILWPALVGIAVNAFLVFFGAAGVLFAVLKRAEQAALPPAVHSDSARLLKDDRLHFSMDIPEGFRDFPDGKYTPSVVYSLHRKSKDGKTAHMIIIEDLNMLLSRSKLTPAQLPPGFNGEIVRKTWRGLEIEDAIHGEKGEGYVTVLHQMHIPLRPKAIRLVVGASGPEIDAAELDQLANQVLASVDGESSW
jgi:hypothetical protein